MHEEYYKWYSPSIDREFEMLVFGHSGLPIILFPTSKGKYYENKDQGMIAAAEWFIDQGKVKIYCPDSLDALSWYNKEIPPAARAYNHTCYDRLIANEIVPRAQRECSSHFVATAGASFGGYHAINFAFRHAEIVSYAFSMSGLFDIRSFVDGYYDDNVYYNNPVDYLPGNNDPHLWSMGIVLGAGEHDSCRQANEILSNILESKNIKHWLDIRPNAIHDWPLWKEMFPHYLSLIK